MVIKAGEMQKDKLRQEMDRDTDRLHPINFYLYNMTIDILTVLPELLESPFAHSIM